MTGRGRRDPNALDLAREPRLVSGPQGARRRVVVVGERVVERGRGTVRRAGVAIEPRRDVARGGPAEPEKRRERERDAQREQRHARDAHGARGEEPGARARIRRETGSRRQIAATIGGQARSTTSARPAACDRAESAGGRCNSVSGFVSSVLRHARPDPPSGGSKPHANQGGSLSSPIISSYVGRGRTTA